MSTNEKSNNDKPDLIVKTRVGDKDAKATYAAIGSGWSTDDGFYLKLHGKQIVEYGLYVFRVALEE